MVERESAGKGAWEAVSLTRESQALTQLVSASGGGGEGGGKSEPVPFVSKDALMQSWLDLSNQSFVFVFPIGSW